MTYDLDFLLAALSFLALLFYHSSTQRRAASAQDRYFWLFMVVGTGDILAELVSSTLIMAARPDLWRVTTLAVTALRLLQTLIPCVLYCYVQSLRHTSERRRRRARLACVLPMAVMLLAVVTDPWTGLLYTVTREGVYLKGPLYPALYVYALLCAGAIVVSSLWHRREMGRREIRAIWEFFLISAACVTVQALFGQRQVTGFGIALGITVLFLTVNNPYQHTDGLTGLLDVRYFHQMCDTEGRHGQKCHLLAVELPQLKSLNWAMGTETGEQMLLQTADTLLRLSHSNQVFRVSDQRFLLLTHSLEEYETSRDILRAYFSQPVSLHGEKVHFPAVIVGVLSCGQVGSSDWSIWSPWPPARRRPWWCRATTRP
jgi:GGDEF domain-containing protein